MDRRKPILTNEYEVSTHAALEEAARKSGAQVFPKVRVADALAIADSGISNDEYSYALRAHFDFVVARSNQPAEFAVEFDGAHHDSDPNTIVLDGLKNSICSQLGLPLLRIDSAFFRRIGRFTLLGWLAEVWFLGQGFADAQERGEVPPDEFFDPRFILFEFDSPSKSFPYDPFLPHRAFIARTAERGLCSFPGLDRVAIDPNGYVTALVLVELPDNRTILGLGRCRNFQFWPVSAYELAQDLAWVDAAEKLRRYRLGEHTPASPSEVGTWIARFSKWDSYR